MINFEEELNKILKEDPLGILKTKVSNPISIDQRLKDSFEEINVFIDENKREPEKTTDILERKLFSRLSELRKDFQKAILLKDIDRHNLLAEVKEIETVDDILNNDVLGLLNDDSESIFNIKNFAVKKNKTDFVARRKPCSNFSNYVENFKIVQKEIKEGKRKLIIHKESHLKEGRYYVLDGILLFLEKIEDTSIKKFNDKTQGSRTRNDPRTRCIFENGLESNMYLRSLGKELYNNGSSVISTNEELLKEFNENFGQIDDDDKPTGHIYILSSLSTDPKISAIQDLYKIGYSTTSVEERIKNVVNDPTYLMGHVKIVSSYKTFNLNPQRFEYLIHNFFRERCLDIEIVDSKNIKKKPKEWYIAPIRVIEQAIELIINNQIHLYEYDINSKTIIKIKELN